MGAAKSGYLDSLSSVHGQSGYRNQLSNSLDRHSGCRDFSDCLFGSLDILFDHLSIYLNSMSKYRNCLSGYLDCQSASCLVI